MFNDEEELQLITDYNHIEGGVRALPFFPDQCRTEISSLWVKYDWRRLEIEGDGQNEMQWISFVPREKFRKVSRFVLEIIP